MKDQRINIGEIELQVREYEQEGDTVIFLHFGGANLMMWQGVIPYFQEAHHLVLVDLRGHGKSAKPQKGYHMDKMAHDVILAMKNMQIDQAHIVGSSLGAEVGVSMAANYPDMVRSLACDGALYSEFGPYGIWEGTEAEFNEHANQTLQRIHNASKEIYPSIDALVDDSRRKFEKHGLWNEIFESVKRYDANEIGEGNYTDSWGQLAEDYTRNYLFHRFEEHYRKVKCPLLMLPDAEQSTIEKKAMIRLIELVAIGKIIYIPEWVHPYGWMLTPESVSRAVVEFIAEARNK